MNRLLRQTKKKLEGALNTIDSIRELDFPYPDSITVLELFHTELNGLKEQLHQSSDATDNFTVSEFCKRVLEKIQSYLPLIGFILRSAELGGPLELHGPLLQITTKALGEDAHLVISSEWDYSPYTFVFPELSSRNFVLVGMPSSEAGNALIAPLSGHELGHNIWAKSNVKQTFEIKVRAQVVSIISNDWDNWKMVLELGDISQLTDLVGIQTWEAAYFFALSQCEEIFCDFIGLGIFGESYLFAFEYLLAPELESKRNYTYPTLKVRAGMLTFAAGKMGIQVPEDFEQGFNDSNDDPDDIKDFGKLSDQVCQQLVGELSDEAKAFIDSHNLAQRDNDEVERIYQTLQRGVPSANVTSIANILAAAWKIDREETFLQRDYPHLKTNEREVALQELILKSFEVFEIERRIAK